MFLACAEKALFTATMITYPYPSASHRPFHLPLNKGIIFHFLGYHESFTRHRYSTRVKYIQRIPVVPDESNYALHLSKPVRTFFYLFIMYRGA